MAKLDLSDEIKEILSEYRAGIVGDINEIGHETIKQLTNETRKTAPKNTGAYKKHIAWTSRLNNKETGTRRFIWHVKGDHYRLTHLLVNGHATRNGGRVPGDPFLKNAVEKATKEYEKAVIERLEKK